MGFSRFGLMLGVRLAFLVVVLSTAGYLIVNTDYPTATLIVLALAALQTVELIRYVSRTNQELARFLDAVRYADFGQRFQFSSLGAGFQELGDTFTYILDRFREDRTEQEGELRHLRAIMEHVPVPLISVYPDGSISVWNNAARRLFGSAQVNRLTDLDSELARTLKEINPGDHTLVRTELGSLPQSLKVSASQIVTLSSTERLISLQNIQTELDNTELAAWEDLVRVLTHEIMNSITPVSSLAKTASDLLEEASNKVAERQDLVAELRDVKDAVDTVARRSDGLMDFVTSYRRLMRLPDPELSRFSVSDLFDDVARIATTGWRDRDINLTMNIEPSGLDIQADRQMLEQVLINLLQNAEQALGDRGGSITMEARLNLRGHVTIEVSDDGPGIPDEVVMRMFVPFYTTRKEGSGVGLALSRQVMNAHGGTISYNASPGGGARFTLAF